MADPLTARWAESLCLVAVKAFSLSGCAWKLEDVEKVTNVLFENRNHYLPARIDSVAHALGNRSQDLPDGTRTYLPNRRLRLSREELRMGAMRERARSKSAARRERYKKVGRCAKCGGPRDQDTLNCSKCLKRNRPYQRKIYRGKRSGCEIEQSRR